MSEQTRTAQQERHDEQNTRADELRTRVLEVLGGENDKTNAAAAARFLIGAFKLLTAARDTLLIQRKANGEDVRVNMVLQMAASVTGEEGIKVTAPTYLQNLQPFIDRLLDAAAESLDAETPATAEGELPDLSVLGEYLATADDISNRTVGYLMTEQDVALEVRCDASLAGWLAADLNDLSDQADSIGYKLAGPFDFLEELTGVLLGGSEPSPADTLSEALKGVDVEVLVGAVYHRYLEVMLPLLSDINTLVNSTVPAVVLEAKPADELLDDSFAELLGGERAEQPATEEESETAPSADTPPVPTEKPKE